MTNKPILIGTFVRKDRILSFFEYLKKRFGILLYNVYVYEVDTNKQEYIATFRAKDKTKYLEEIRKSVVLHTKNGSLFSINAINKLIESNAEGVNQETKEIDWDLYKNKLLLLTNGQLSISSIRKIEDKAVFLQ